MVKNEIDRLEVHSEIPIGGLLLLLQDLRYLKELDLSNAVIDANVPGFLSERSHRLHALTSLKLKFDMDNQYFASLSALLKTLPGMKLNYLEFIAVRFTASGLQELVNYIGDRLHKFTIQQTDLNDSMQYLCKIISQSPNLKSFNAPLNDMRDHQFADIIACIKRFQGSLVSVDVSGNKLTDLQSFSKEFESSGIQTLVLSENLLSVDGINELSQIFKKQNQLKKLFLQNCRLSDCIGQRLFKSFLYDAEVNLVTLDLGGNCLETSYYALKYLIQRDCKIQSLYLDNNLLSNSDLVQFFKHFRDQNFKKLKQLDLRNNKFNYSTILEFLKLLDTYNYNNVEILFDADSVQHWE